MDGNSAEPLSETARARMDALVANAFNQFVGNVVKGRGQGMTAERVKNDWKAYVYGADEAKALGMIDRIATLDETLTRLLTDSPEAADHEAAELLLSPIAASDQEPRLPAATSQERLSETQWQNTIDRALLELDF